MNILNNLQSMFGKSQTNKKELTKEEIATLLQTSPETLAQFENAYWEAQQELDISNDNFFQTNSRIMSKKLKGEFKDISELDILIETIVEELLVEAGLLDKQLLLPINRSVLESFPKKLRPQLSGKYMQRDLGEQETYSVVLYYYQEYIKETDPSKKFSHYMRFLQGLDLLDLDTITYEILGMNINSIEHWFPKLEKAILKQDFFKVPITKFVKVPLTILQLTRLDYLSLTPTTLKIVDEFCMRAFDLDTSKDYFIKTGTYSSKFDFRNAKVSGSEEVKEIGQYLLFIHHQALQMASMLNNVSIPGVSTTNTWCVREFIPDVENNPCIYKGMPLHTEYRFFVDLDTKDVLGVSPYWREDVMKANLSEGKRASDPDKIHDYIIYTAHEPVLYQRYKDNVGRLQEEISKLLTNIELKGQWSIDVMQNGSDFYIIDMALANQSALNDVVSSELLKEQQIDWIPRLD